MSARVTEDGQEEYEAAEYEDYEDVAPRPASYQAPKVDNSAKKSQSIIRKETPSSNAPLQILAGWIRLGFVVWCAAQKRAGFHERRCRGGLKLGRRLSL